MLRMNLSKIESLKILVNPSYLEPFDGLILERVNVTEVCFVTFIKKLKALSE